MPRLPKGFTLLELIVTLAIAGILTGIAIPNFVGLLKNNRLISKNNDLLTALTLGKSEALKRATSVTLCKRNALGTNCDSGRLWSDGWLLFNDLNSNAAVDAADEVLRVYEPLPTGISLTYAFNQVTFNSLGFSSGYTGTFKFCDDRGATYSRGLIIAHTGQLTQPDDADLDGIKEDINGNNFTCP